MQLTGKCFDIEAAYSFEECSGGRTRLTQNSSITGKGVFQVLLWVMSLLPSKAACEASAKELGRLAATMESVEWRISDEA